MPHSSPSTSMSAAGRLRLPRIGETATARCRDSHLLPAFVTEEVFAVVLASADPDVVPLMLLVVVTEEVFADVLANDGPGVVPLMLLVVEMGGAVDESGGSPPWINCVAMLPGLVGPGLLVPSLVGPGLVDSGLVVGPVLVPGSSLVPFVR